MPDVAAAERRIASAALLDRYILVFVVLFLLQGVGLYCAVWFDCYVKLRKVRLIDNGMRHSEERSRPQRGCGRRRTSRVIERVILIPCVFLRSRIVKLGPRLHCANASDSTPSLSLCSFLTTLPIVMIGRSSSTPRDQIDSTH